MPTSRDGADAAAAAASVSVAIAVESSETESSGGEKKGIQEWEKQGDVAVDLELDGDQEWEEGKVCRICHLSPDRRAGEEGLDLIQLGCGCKDELGTAHRHCAETWFRMKGNRCCEICGVFAKNITGEEDGSFMVEWHERRVRNSSGIRNSSERAGFWRGQPFCNFLMACLVIAFILPWFFRVNMF